MVKKILLSTACVAGLAWLFLGSAAVSHVGQLFGAAKDKVAESFPIEYELERAEGMVRKIGPEVEKAKRTVAEEQVDIGELEREIVRIERRAEVGGEKVRLQNAALKTGEKTYVVGARTIGRGQLENELRMSFDGLKNDNSLLEAKRRLLEARTAALSAAVQKLEVVRSEEANLRTNIESLRARLRHTQAMEACSNRITLDDGALAQAKEILARCQKRISIAAKMVENESGSIFAAPTGADHGDVTAEVDRYFGSRSGEATVEGAATVAAPADRGGR